MLDQARATKKPSYAVERCPDAFIRPTVERDHYLRRWPDPRSEPFGYKLVADHIDRHSDGRPLGILVFKLLQHKRQRGVFGYPGLPTQWQVLDLARVWVHPSLQENRWQGLNRKGAPALMKSNDFSRMVSLALRRVQYDWLDHHGVRYQELPYHVTLILSYCDRKHHQGIGYRAAGFDLIGETSDGTKDVYERRLRQPRWEWIPKQAPLFEVAYA